MDNVSHKQKILHEGEYLVAIRTGKNYWHILTGREQMMTMREAEDYAISFTNSWQTAVLKVESVTTKELIPTLVMKNPLMAPATTPTRRAIGTATQPEVPKTSIKYPAVIVARPPIAPTERFIPPTTRAMA